MGFTSHTHTDDDHCHTSGSDHLVYHKLQELSDVDTAAPENGQHLVWNASNAVWTNRSLSESMSGISAQAGNIIQAGTDGFAYFSAADVVANETLTSVVPNYAGNEFVYTDEAGTALTVDMTQFSTQPDLILTTGGTATGISTSGVGNHVVDITVNSADAGNSISIGTDGGVLLVQEPLVITTDSTVLGVTQSGTDNHTANIVLLSTDANNDLSIGTDGGLLITETLPDSPAIDGTYTLQVVVVAGIPTYSWI